MSLKHPAEPDFDGVIGRTIAQSEPSWPAVRQAKGAPNVVLVVLDDTGFAHLGCYGSTLATPNIDRLAAEGLRYSGFHTTALCSSSRACLLTGRNHHAVGVRAISNFDTGFPNMRGAVTPRAATLAEMLRGAGYATFAAGKWHLAPMAECTAAGPFDNWPLRKGFDGFYGFLQGETDQFHPELTRDNHFVGQPKSATDGYHVSEDITERSMAFVRDQVSLMPERPFFLYLAFGAMHAPHQAPAAFLNRWRGAFDEGWDVARERWFERQKAMGLIPESTRLAPRNPGVKPWAELTDSERAFAARLQEAFAAMLEHTDQQIGRLTEFLRELGILDETLFVLVSDNGASQEGGATGTMDEMRYFNLMTQDVAAAIERLDDIGGPASHCNIPWGWAQAGNTPLRWYKQNTHGGGVRDPLIIRWPARINDPGGLRHQFCHAVDIAPTILEAAGQRAPETMAGFPQMPMHGASLAQTLAAPAASLARSVQYFEMVGHRGLWLDGWKAVTRHQAGTPFDEDVWELYHLDADFSETHDLAASEPERLEAMKAAWWREAETHGALPLDDRGLFELFRASRRAGLPTSRERFVYRPPISHLVSDACPPAARGWRMSLDIDHHGSDGALVARGSLNSGFVLYVKGGRLVFDYNAFHDHSVVAASGPMPAGRRLIELVVARQGDGSASVTLDIDGQRAASGVIPRLLFIVSSLGMDFGASPRPVCEAYEAPFAYGGVIRSVIFELPRMSAELARAADKALVTAAMSRQ
ncbi:MAG TPA: arylsulfatase [Caulobacteraceae bacterium]|nr:arylsulfatase [Caulobacteraceae bacterium]